MPIHTPSHVIKKTSSKSKIKKISSRDSARGKKSTGKRKK